MLIVEYSIWELLTLVEIVIQQVGCTVSLVQSNYYVYSMLQCWNLEKVLQDIGVFHKLCDARTSM